VLYASGEESAGQIRLRAARLGLLDDPAGEAIRVITETEVGRILERVRAERPALLVVDSVQTIGSDELDGPPGSVGQVRECTLRLMEVAKGEGVAVVLVGHVTKDGTLAGPKSLEHIVDVVLQLEGDRTGGLRLLRATKNRFGSTDEVGVFEMRDRGLDELADPARAFLGEHEAAPGSVVAPVLEGSRPLLVEVQALVAPSSYPSPRRTTSGLDGDRLALLIAVLGRRAGIGLGSHDVYANLAGGLSVSEPGLDLALAVALASSLRDQPVRPGTVVIGEVGLLGELRQVSGLERRVREAARLGFTSALVPAGGRGRPTPEIAGLDLRPATTLREAIADALAGGPGPIPPRIEVAAR
jgi:DNA repair protein RadA/Sms